MCVEEKERLCLNSFEAYRALKTFYPKKSLTGALLSGQRPRLHSYTATSALRRHCWRKHRSFVVPPAKAQISSRKRCIASTTALTKRATDSTSRCDQREPLA